MTNTDKTTRTIVRETIEAMTTVSRREGQDRAVWDSIHHASVIDFLEAAGHGALVLEALEHAARTYGVEVQR